MAAVLELKSRATGKPNGRRAVQFDRIGSERSRKRERDTIRLGKVSATHADNVRRHIDNLLAARLGRRAPEWSTVEWLASVAPKLHRDLVRFGLVDPREEDKAVPIGPFTAGYIAKRKDLKPRTRTNLEQARKMLAGFFKLERDLRTITRGEAKDWRRWMQTDKKLSRATIATHVKKARQFFADAQDRKFITENPFKQVEAGKQSNEDRQEYVDVRTILQVIDHCPDDEWKLLFALARFGGLRVPSETELLEWADIDWTGGRMFVRSPKTEHHEGKEARTVPLFAELRPYLEAARASAPEGARHVLARLRNTNPRTRARKIIKRAKLEPWPKLFQNLRSSCQTDLTAKFPRHVACAWVGNTEDVAKRHYLQVTDADFDRAAGGADKSAAQSADGTSGQQPTGTALATENPGKPQIPLAIGTAVPFANTPKGGSTPPKSHRQNRTDLNPALAEALPNDLSAEQVDKIKRSAAVARAMAAVRGGARG